jgi:pimeloyl-ACP methyl ester carboxylesterase
MERVELDGVQVAFEVHGSGGPVVLIQAPPFVTWYQPILAYLCGRSVLWYRRHDDGIGFGVEDDARLCGRLLTHVGFVRPHVVGHSYGGIVALELARQRSVDIRSLALLEPAPAGLAAPAAAAAQMAPLLRMARDSGAAAAMEHFLRGACAGLEPDALELLVPGALRDASMHAERFFACELPAAIRWSFTPADAALVNCPILNLRGARSGPRFQEASAVIQSWFPSAESEVLDGASHLLMAQHPEAAARCLECFWDCTGWDARALSR